MTLLFCLREHEQSCAYVEHRFIEKPLNTNRLCLCIFLVYFANAAPYRGGFVQLLCFMLSKKKEKERERVLNYNSSLWDDLEAQ